MANFGLLPILAKSFWKIARQSGDFPNKKDFYNEFNIKFWGDN